MDLKPVLPLYESYLRDESRFEGSAGYIAFPQHTAEAAELIRASAVKGAALTIQGSRTGICGGAAPRGGIALCTQKMNLPLDCRAGDAGNPVLRVGAGMSFADLSVFLARGVPPADWTLQSKRFFENCFSRQSYRFSVSPTETSASLGGAFAVNARGPDSLRYGATAGRIAELAWITPQGEIWELRRGRYVFDALGCTLPDGSRLAVDAAIPRGGFSFLCPYAGLDLIDFLAASEGKTGMAAELGLALDPVPARWAVVFFFRTPQGALDFANALGRWHKKPAGGFLSWAEYYDRAVLDLVQKGRAYVSALTRLPFINPEFQSAVHVELEGEEPENLEDALAGLLEMFTDCGGCDDDTWAALDNAEVEKYRLLRHGAPECINMEVDKIRQRFADFHKTASDFEIPPASAAQWVCRYHRDIEQAGLRGFVFGHILQGRLHVNLLAQNAHEFSRCKELMEAWAALVLREGGLLASENGIGKIKVPLVMRYISAQRLDQIQTILAALDPKDILGGRKNFS